MHLGVLRVRGSVDRVIILKQVGKKYKETREELYLCMNAVI